MNSIIYIFRYVNNKSLNIKMYYSYLYFRYQNRELLEHDFCFKISIYKNRVKSRTLLKMLLKLNDKGICIDLKAYAVIFTLPLFKLDYSLAACRGCSSVALPLIKLGYSLIAWRGCSTMTINKVYVWFTSCGSSS